MIDNRSTKSNKKLSFLKMIVMCLLTTMIFVVNAQLAYAQDDGDTSEKNGIYIEDSIVENKDITKEIVEKNKEKAISKTSYSDNIDVEFTKENAVEETTTTQNEKENVVEDTEKNTIENVVEDVKQNTKENVVEGITNNTKDEIKEEAKQTQSIDEKEGIIEPEKTPIINTTKEITNTKEIDESISETLSEISIDNIDLEDMLLNEDEVNIDEINVIDIVESLLGNDDTKNVYIYGEDTFIIVAEDKNGKNATKYDVNTTENIELNGTDKQEIYYFDLTGTYDKLKTIKINGGNGIDIITTSLKNGEFSATNCDIEFVAEKIIFEMSDSTKWNIKSLKIITELTDDKSLRPSTSVKLPISLKNIDIEVGNDMSIDVSVNMIAYESELFDFTEEVDKNKLREDIKTLFNGTDNKVGWTEKQIGSFVNVEFSEPDKELETENLQKIKELEKDNSIIDKFIEDYANKTYLAGVRNINIDIIIDSCNITANNIILNANVKSIMYTLATFLPITVDVINITNKIDINNSKLIARNGKIDIVSLSESELNATLLQWLNKNNNSLIISVINNYSEINLEGNTSLSASSDINISNTDNIKNKTEAVSVGQDEKKNAFAVSVIVQNTLVDIKDSVSIISNDGNIKVLSNANCENDTSSFINDDVYKKQSEELKDIINKKWKEKRNTKDILIQTIKDTWNIAKAIVIEDKKIIDDESEKKVDETLNDADNIANDSNPNNSQSSESISKELSEKFTSEESTDKIQNKKVATMVILVSTNINEILLETNGNLEAENGVIDILAKEHLKNNILSDANVTIEQKTNDDKEQKTDKVNGNGTAFSLGVIVDINDIFIKTKPSIKAKSLSVQALSGEDSKDENSIKANSAYAVAEKGNGVVIAVNTNVRETLVEIEDGASLELNGLDLNLKASEKSNSTINATSKATTQGEKDSKELDIVLVINTDIHNTKVLVNGKLLGEINNLSIEAIQEVQNTVKIEAGNNNVTGTSVIPAVVVNVFDSENSIYISKNVDIHVNGNTSIKATSKNNNNVSVLGALASEKFGLSATVLVDIDNFITKTIIDGLINAIGNVDINAISENSSTSQATSNISSTFIKENKKEDEQNTESNEKTKDKDVEVNKEDTSAIIEKDSSDVDVKNDTSSDKKDETSSDDIANIEVSQSENEQEKTKENTSKKDGVNGWFSSIVETSREKVREIAKKNLNTNKDGNNKEKGSDSSDDESGTQKEDSEPKLQRAETAEGSVEIVAVVTIQLVKDIVKVEVNNSLITEGNLSVESKSNLNATSTADGSADASKANLSNAIGATVALQTVNKETTAIIENAKEIIANKININASAENKYSNNVVLTSGASNVGIAGGVSISCITPITKAYIDSELIKTKDDIDINALQNNNYKVNANAQANNSKIEFAEDTKKDSNNEEVQKTEKETTEDKKENSSVGIGAGFAMAIVNEEILSCIGENTKNVVTLGSLNINAKKVIEKDGLIVITQAGNQEKNAEMSKKAIDAGVAILIMQSNINSFTNKDTKLDVAKDLQISAITDNNSQTKAVGCANADDVSVGATVALSIIHEDINAIMASEATVGNNIKVIATANTNDVSEAWATAKGVKTKSFAEGYSDEAEKILNGEYILEFLAKEDKPKENSEEEKGKKALSEKLTDRYGDTKTVNTDTSDIVDINNITKTDENGDTISNIDKNTTTTQAGEVKSGNSVSVAAGVSCNIINHNVLAKITGVVKKSASIEISATNDNNFQSVAKGDTVNDNTAIAATIAVMINNCDSVALVENDVNVIGDDTENANNNLKVLAITQNNVNDEFTFEITSFAVGGTGSGESSKVGVVGAVAIMISNATTTAKISENTNVNVLNGDVYISANEKNKLSAKALSANISSEYNMSNLTDESKNNNNINNDSTNTNDTESKSAGVGLAFAMLTSNSNIYATLEKGVYIKANNVSVLAIKTIVTRDEYENRAEINGVLTVGRELKDIPLVGTVDLEKEININNTDDPQNTENKIDFEQLVNFAEQYGIDTINSLASVNYYVDAIGGSIDTSSEKSGVQVQGSIAMMFYNDIIKATITDDVIIEFNTEVTNNDEVGKLEVNANSTLNTTIMAGSAGIGTNVGVGTAIQVLVSDANVEACIGSENTNKVKILNQREVIVDANLENSLLLIGVSAGAQVNKDKKDVSVIGTIGVLTSNSNVQSYIKNADIFGKGNINVKSNNGLDTIEVLGGCAISKNVGVGATIGVNVIKNVSIAFIDKDVIIGSVEEKAGNIEVLANSKEWILNVVANGSGSNEQASVSASPAIFIVNTNVKSGLYTNTVYAKSLKVLTDSCTEYIVIVGGISVSIRNTSVGGAVSVIVLNKNVNAVLEQEDKNNVSFNVDDIEVLANSKEKLISVVAGMSISGKTTTVAGSIDVIVMNNNTNAYVNANGEISNNAFIKANDDIIILAVAGGIGIGSKVGVGFANVDIVFNGDTIAYMETTNGLNIGGSLDISSVKEENILSIVSPMGITGKDAVAGGIGVVVFNENVNSYIKGNIYAGDISVIAKDVTNLKNIVANISASGNVAVGGSIGEIVFLKNANAFIENGSHIITSKGNVILKTECVDNVLSIVSGVSGTGKCAVNGSILNEVISDKVATYIKDGSIGNKTFLDVAGDLVIITNNLQEIKNVTGAISASGSSAVGGAINTVIFSGSSESYLGEYTECNVNGSQNGFEYFDGDITLENDETIIKNSKNHQGILITSTNNQIIDNWAVSGEGSGSVAVGGSVIVTTFEENTTAAIKSNCNVISKKGIAVIALDESKITSQAGQITGSGVVAVGVGSDTLYLNKKVRAYIDENSTVKALGGDLLVIADSYEFLRSVTVGVGGSGSVAVNGSVSVVVIENDLLARIGAQSGLNSAKETVIESYGSTVIKAEDYKNIVAVSGNAEGAGGVAVGAGVSVITSEQTTNAYMGNNVIADVLGTTGVSFYTGNIDSFGRKEKKKLYGLLIGAFNTNNVHQVVFAASGAGVAAVACSSATMVNNDITSAMINSNARINQGNREYSSKAIVKVVAIDKSDLETLDAGGAGGTVGVGAAVVVTTFNKTTIADIEKDVFVYAKCGVEVNSYSYNNSDIISAGLGGGAVGVAGTSNTYVVSDYVQASIGGNIISDGYIDVLAKTSQNVKPISGVVSGGAVGVGATVIVFTFKGKTLAFAKENTNIKAMDRVSIIADAEQKLLLETVGASGGAVGVAGSVGVVNIMNITEAFTENSVDINTIGEFVLKAIEYSNLSSISGDIAGGAIGVGATTNVFVYRNTVTAMIGENNTIVVDKATVQADNNRNIKARAVGTTGGAIGVNGSVLITLVGAKSDEEIYSYEGASVNSDKYLDSSAQTTDKTIEESYNKVKINDNEENGEIIIKANEYIIKSKENTDRVDIIFNKSNAEDKTVAMLGKNSSIKTISGDVNILSNDITNMDYIAGEIVGGAIGVGASVAVATFDGRAESIVAGDIDSNTYVKVLSNSKVSAEKFYTVAGTGGAIGVGAAVSVANINSSANAYQISGDIKANKDVYIKSVLDMEVTPYTVEANVSGISVGAAVAVSNVSGETNAYINNLATISKSENVHINAISNVITSPKTQALSGGLVIAGNGAVSVVNVRTIINASVSGSIKGNVKNVEIIATLYQDTKVKAYGVAISGACAGGATVVYLNILPTIRATVQNAIIDIQGELVIYSLYNYILNNDEFVKQGTNSVEVTASNIALAATFSGAVAYVKIEGVCESFIKNSSISTDKDIALLSLGNFDTKIADGQISVALIAGVGAAIVNANIDSKTNAYIENSNVVSKGDIAIVSKYTSDFTSEVKGTNGGLLVAGNAQTLSLSQKEIILAYVDNSNINADGSIIINAKNETQTDTEVKGTAISGFVSGGLTYVDVRIDRKNLAYIGDNCIVNVGGNIEIISLTQEENFDEKLESIRATNTIMATASAGALGVGGAGVIANINVNDNTNVKIGSNSTLVTNNGKVIIKAYSKNANDVYGTELAGGIILAAGETNTGSNIRENTQIIIGNNVIISAIDEVYMSTNAIDKNIVKAIGGQGGIVSANYTEAKGTEEINSSIITGNDVKIISKNSDVSIYSFSEIYSRYRTEIEFSVDVAGILKTETVGSASITNNITFGTNVDIIGNNVTIWSEVKRVDRNAYTTMSTVGIFHTKARPNSILITDINANINANTINISARENLVIMAIVDTDLNITTYSYGEIAGALGSIISETTNNTNAKAKINIQGSKSVISGDNVTIKTSAPRESEVTYVKEAKYKANTVTEFVHKTVEKICVVVETVVDRVCSWLGWLGKVIKTVVRTITKIVRVLVDIIVEVVLQSECDSRENGSYNFASSITLNGSIYYGSCSNVKVYLDETVAGVISSSNAINYEVDETNKTITVEKFVGTSQSGMVIEATNGNVDGDVTIYNNKMVQNFDVFNRTSYALIVKTINLTVDEESESAGTYVIKAMNNTLKIKDTTTITEQPVIKLENTTGTAIIFDGDISNPSAKLIIEFSGNSNDVYMTENARIEIGKLIIKNARNVGTKEKIFVVNMYASVLENGEIEKSAIDINATNDIYIKIYKKQLVLDLTEEQVKTIVVEDFEVSNFIAGGNLNIDIAGTYIVTLINKEEEEIINIPYTYIDYEYLYEEIKEDIYSVEVDGMIEYYYLDNFTDENGTEHEKDEIFVYDKSKYMDIIYKDGKYKFIVGRVEVEKVGVEQIPINVINTDIVEYEVSSIWSINKAIAENVQINVITNKESNLYLYDITSTDSIFINANKMNIFVDGIIKNVSEYTNIIEISTENEVVFREGTIGNNFTITNIIIKAKQIKTLKLTNYDIKAKQMIISSNNGDIGVLIGTKENPIRILTGKDGININAENGEVYIYSDESLYIEKLKALENVFVNAKNIYNLKVDKEDFDVTIISKEIYLNALDSIGTKENAFRIECNTKGLTCIAKNNIYLKSIKDLYLSSIETEKLVDIKVVDGSLLNAFDSTQQKANITANEILLDISAGSIGTKENMISIDNKIVGNIEANAFDLISILFVEKSNVIQMISKTSEVLLHSKKDIAIEEIVANKDVSVITEGSQKIKYIESEETNVLLDAKGDYVEVEDIIAKGNVSIITEGSQKIKHIENEGTDVLLDAKGDYVEVENIIAKGNVSIITEGSQKIKHIENEGTSVLLGAKGDYVEVENIIAKGNVSIITEGSQKIKHIENEGTKVLLDAKGDYVEIENIVAKGNVVIYANGRLNIVYIESKTSNIAINTKDRNVYVKFIIANKDVFINSLGNIVSVQKEEATNIVAKTIKISAKNIGEKDYYFVVNALENGLYLYSTENIYLKDIEDDIELMEVNSMGTVNIKSVGEMYIFNMNTLNSDMYAEGNIWCANTTAIGNIILTTQKNIYMMDKTHSKYNDEKICIIANVLELNAEKGCIGTSEEYLITDMNGEESRIYGISNNAINLMDIDGVVRFEQLKSNTSVINVITNGNTDINCVIAPENIDIKTVNGNVNISCVMTEKDVFVDVVGSVYNMNDIEDWLIDKDSIEENINITSKNLYLTVSLNVGERDEIRNRSLVTDIDTIYTTVGKEVHILNAKDLNIVKNKTGSNARYKAYGNVYAKEIESKGDFGVDTLDKGTVFVYKAKIDGSCIINAMEKVTIQEIITKQDMSIQTERNIEVFTAVVQKNNNMVAKDEVFVKNITIDGNNYINSNKYIDIANLPIKGDNYMFAKEYIISNNLNVNKGSYIESEGYIDINNINIDKDNVVVSKDYIQVGSINARGNNIIKCNSNVDMENLNVIGDNETIIDGHLNLKYVYISKNNTMKVSDYIDIYSINIWGENAMQSDESLKINRIEVANDSKIVVNGNIDIGEFSGRGNSDIILSGKLKLSRNMIQGKYKEHIVEDISKYKLS